MGKYEKLLAKVMGGDADNNIAFDDLCWLLERRGFEARIKGSHRSYSFSGLPRPLVIQPRSDGKSKNYQVALARVAFSEISSAEVEKI